MSKTGRGVFVDTDRIRYVGWHDASRRVKPARKLAEAMELYVEKRGRPADICLTSPGEALELAGNVPGVLVQGRSYMEFGKYYVGEMRRDA